MGTIDCDVMVGVPSAATLRPYLSTHWQRYLDESKFRGTPGPGQVYPSWSPTLRVQGSETSLEKMRDAVLRRADVAVIHCYYGVEGVTHPFFAQALASAVNRWLEAEWLDAEDRLRASLVVTPHVADAAVAEIEAHAEDDRFVQVMLPSRAFDPYGNHRYWPIFDAAAAAGLALGLVPGGSGPTPPTPTGWPASFAEEYALAPLAFESHLTSLVFSGVLQRHEDLKVVLTQSGVTWLPALMWRLDQEWKAARREVPWLAEAPSAYVRRHFRLTTTPLDSAGVASHTTQVIDQLGSNDMLLYGSAFPHQYPGDPQELLDHLAPDHRAKVLGDNAEATFGTSVRRGQGLVR